MTVSDSNTRIFLTLCALSMPLLLWISIGSNAHIEAFLDVSSLVLLPLLIVGLNFVRAQFAKDEQSWIERMPTSTALATMVCVVIGFVGVVINFDDPSAIGPATALAFLSLFYGGVFALMGFTLNHRLPSNPQQAEDTSRSIVLNSVALFIFCVVGMSLTYVAFGEHLVEILRNALFSVVVTPVMFALMVQLGGGLSAAKAKLADSQTEAETRSKLLTLFGRTAVITGLLGFVIGQIDMLSNLSDPNALGKAFASTLSPMFYGLVFSIAACVVLKSGDSAYERGAISRVLRTAVLSVAGGLACGAFIFLIIKSIG